MSLQQQRYDQLVAWAHEIMHAPPQKIELLSGDASFRRYFRAFTDKGPQVLVDADPAHEKTCEFVQIAKALVEAKVCVPQVHAVDQEQGFMLLDDLGDHLLLGQLDNHNVEALYSLAIDELLRIQQCQCDVRNYDAELLRQEMSLFNEWFLPKYLDMTLTPTIEAMLSNVYQHLIDSALEQPKVFVHLDYHSRNLMTLENGRLGVLDFQDAAMGPITYDLVSLLRDCYVAWPQEQVANLVAQFREKAAIDVDAQTFWRWFDWMGLQRHLKCLGVFTRLNFRDNKPGYLADIPRVMRYVRSVTSQYSEFAQFDQFLQASWRELPR